MALICIRGFAPPRMRTRIRFHFAAVVRAFTYFTALESALVFSVQQHRERAHPRSLSILSFRTQEYKRI